MKVNPPYARMNISIPATLAMEMKRFAPRRGISRFLAEAASEKMTKMKREKALKALLAAPPTFTNIKNASAYVRTLRRESEKRARRFGI